MFCSIACYGASRPKTTRKCRTCTVKQLTMVLPKGPKLCAYVQCKASFTGRGNFCSKECGRLCRNWKYRLRTGIPDTTNCARCAKPFRPKRTDAIFCSRRCKGAAHSRRGYYRNREGYNRRRAKYLKSHKAETAATAQAYRDKNREFIRQRAKVYYAKNKARWINFKLMRRAREKTSPEEMERCRVFVEQVKAQSVHVCYYCEKRFRGAVWIDHVIALAKGGKHEVGNLCTACQKCNQAKSAKSPKDFMVNGQVFLAL